MSTPKSIKIDNVEYFPANSEPVRMDGMLYAIVRSHDQGVMAGYVKSICDKTVTLRQARQLWVWDSAFVLVELAEHGVRDAGKCSFSCESSQLVVMLEACGVLYATDRATESIRAVPAKVNK